MGGKTTSALQYGQDEGLKNLLIWFMLRFCWPFFSIEGIVEKRESLLLTDNPAGRLSMVEGNQEIKEL
ncbi:MAG: hypothetical protein CMI36_08545 [Owenweeksia sp.]|nr:hypothetical protein [Owenweeksia sp.]MBF99028.1 hypothetical protein [Owenweeksia sp.]HBF20646.1 hypothetical protein [Cryomorphaceae bacterium]HCQ15823.1 hypothetical protein [Cryomorphaceae bacterium]